MGRAVLTMPKSAPISFIREGWARHVLRGGGIDRRYYELCVLSELRDRLRAGDVWVVGSRRYRAFEERLISRETLKELAEPLERAGRWGDDAGPPALLHHQPGEMRKPVGLAS